MIQTQLKANYKNFKGSTKSLFGGKSTTDLNQTTPEQELVPLALPPKSILKDNRVEFADR